MIYDLIAPIYDEINSDIDYAAWAEFIDATAKRELGHKPELALDLAAGTGSMTIALAERGYDMTAIDYSPEMLNIAKERAEARGIDNILWLLQDMREFELYGTVELVCATLDSINHLDSKSDLKKCFSLVHNYLSPDGIFIFDVNSKYKFENVYSDNTYTMETADSFCIWQNDYNPKTKLCDFYITLFKETEDGRYIREDEIQREKMYSLKELKSALLSLGFEFIGAYSDFDLNKADENSCDRIYIVARCKK